MNEFQCQQNSKKNNSHLYSISNIITDSNLFHSHNLTDRKIVNRWISDVHPSSRNEKTSPVKITEFTSKWKFSNVRIFFTDLKKQQSPAYQREVPTLLNCGKHCCGSGVGTVYKGRKFTRHQQTYLAWRVCTLSPRTLLPCSLPRRKKGLFSLPRVSFPAVAMKLPSRSWCSIAPGGHLSFITIRRSFPRYFSSSSTRLQYSTDPVLHSAS